MFGKKKETDHTAQHSTALALAQQRSTTLRSTTHHSTAQHDTSQQSTVQHTAQSTAREARTTTPQPDSRNSAKQHIVQHQQHSTAGEVLDILKMRSRRAQHSAASQQHSAARHSTTARHRGRSKNDGKSTSADRAEIRQPEFGHAHRTAEKRREARPNW